MLNFKIALYILLHCTILCRTVLYCTVLYCTVLYSTVLYCTVLCTVLYCSLLVLYCTVMYVLLCPCTGCLFVHNLFFFFTYKFVVTTQRVAITKKGRGLPHYSAAIQTARKKESKNKYFIPKKINNQLINFKIFFIIKNV